MRTVRIDPSKVPAADWEIACRVLQNSIRLALADPEKRADYERWEREQEVAGRSNDYRDNKTSALAARCENVNKRRNCRACRAYLAGVGGGSGTAAKHCVCKGGERK